MVEMYKIYIIVALDGFEQVPESLFDLLRVLNHYGPVPQTCILFSEREE